MHKICIAHVTHISLRHSSEREALVGYLAGQWKSHMYPSEDSAKRPLAHAIAIIKIQTKRAKLTGFHTVTTAKCSHSAIVTFLDEIWSFHRVYVH